MAEIRKPAVPILQGGRTLYLTSFTVRDIMRDGLYRVDRLDVQAGRGMQRLLNMGRARSFARDFSDADRHNQAFLPTSVFWATEGSVSYDERAKEIFFDDAEHSRVCPFDVVDGQHRLEGLKEAAESNERLLDFPISVVIAHKMNEAERMLQFLIVNTKQQPVDQGVAQFITARFTQMDGVQDLPYLPGWLDKQVKRGSDDQALQIARTLNSDKSSSWRGRIQFAHETKSRQHTITQKSFVAAVKRLVLNPHHPYNDLPLQPEKRVAVLINYWNAVDKLFVHQPDDNHASPDSSGPPRTRLRIAADLRRHGDARTSSVVYKSNGVEFFLSVFSSVLTALARDRQFTQDAIVRCLESAADHLEPHVLTVMSPEFWKSGGGASNMNRSGIRDHASAFRTAISQAHEDDVQV